MRPERSVRWLPVRTATVALAFVLVQPMLIGTAAAVPTVVAVNETRVTIPFVPPVGKTLHYRLSRSQSDSKKDKATSIDLYVRLSVPARTDTDCILEWR